MIKKLYLQNFRCFDKHYIELRPMGIIVGANNAGKSTTIEALRILSLVTNRFGLINFVTIPDWLADSDFNVGSRGIKPSLKGIEFNALSIFHNLGDPPALIHAEFDNGTLVDIYLGPDASIYAVIKDQDQRSISNKSNLQSIELPKIAILPQIGPISPEEQILDPDYIRRTVSSSLSSLHFRNQLNLYPQYFEDFKKLAEST
jgi:hypothetical protein